MHKSGTWKHWRLFLIALLAIVFTFGIVTGCAPPDPDPDPDPDEVVEDPPDRISVRWNTADVGSYGYSVASMMVDFLNRELPEEYTVTVHPFPSTSACMRAAMDGDGDIAYTADVSMGPVWERTDPFDDLDPDVGELVHTFYAYPMETFLVVLEDNIDDYNSWGDLDGEPVFFTPAGYMNWMNMGRIFNALGYEFNHTEIDSGLTADALRDGSIMGAAAYTTAGRSLPTWWAEAEMRADIAVVNPTEEEQDTLREAGLAPVTVDPEEAFTQDVLVDEIIGVPILFAYNVRADADHDFVYQMMNIFYGAAEDLAGMDPGFGPLADDFIGMQVSGISANPDVPVHSGTAEFLQEHDAWDEAWIIAE